MEYCPKSSMPVEVFNWLLDHLSHLSVRAKMGRPPLELGQRLDAFWLVVGEGLSYRQAARVLAVSKSEIGISIYLLTGPIAGLGLCQPDGTFIKTLADLEVVLREMAASREPVCLDGMGIQTQKPYHRPNQYQLWDHHHHQVGVRATVVSDCYDTLLWVDGGWPGNCAERAACEVAGITMVLIESKVPVLADRGYRVRDKSSWPMLVTPLARWNQQLQWDEKTKTVNYLQAGLRASVERTIAHLAHARAFRKWRGRLALVRDVLRAAATVICLNRWLSRVPA